jgi:hypothetical protein
LLDTYTAERHPVGARVLMNTRAQAALMRPDALTTALREIVSDVMKIEAANQYFGEMVSGVATRYDLGDEDPLVGRLVSNLTLELPEGEAKLYSFMQEGDAILFAPSPEVAATAEGRVKVIRTKSGPSMLIRPDGCIAWASENEAEPGARRDAALERLRAALLRWFGDCSSS